MACIESDETAVFRTQARRDRRARDAEPGVAADGPKAAAAERDRSTTEGVACWTTMHSDGVR